MMAEAANTVVLVDDHDLIRQVSRAHSNAMRTSRYRRGRFGGRGLQQVAATRPSVVVTDVRLPDGTGLDLVRSLRKESPEMGIVVLTMYAGDEHSSRRSKRELQPSWPKTPLLTTSSPPPHATVSPRSFTAANLADAMRRRMTPSGPRLSPREQQVLRLLADGLGLRESRANFSSPSRPPRPTSRTLTRNSAPRTAPRRS